MSEGQGGPSQEHIMEGNGQRESWVGEGTGRGDAETWTLLVIFGAPTERITPGYGVRGGSQITHLGEGSQSSGGGGERRVTRPRQKSRLQRARQASKQVSGLLPSRGRAWGAPSSNL